jgi:hypothetical protein
VRPCIGLTATGQASNEIKLAEILDADDNTPLKQLQTAVAHQGHGKSVAAYKSSVEDGQACHKATDTPDLRPRTPDRPVELMTNPRDS